jgi:hypothetical protein
VSDSKACIWCGESVKAAALICRFCNRDQTAPVSEHILFDGHPRLLAYLGLFLMDLLLCFVAVGFFLLPYHYIKIITTRVRITTKRITEETGLISKTIDNLELYRVKDHAFKRTLGDFFIGTGTIWLASSDVSDSELRIGGLPNAKAIYQELTAAIESCRREEGVRVREVE